MTPVPLNELHLKFWQIDMILSNNNKMKTLKHVRLITEHASFSSKMSYSDAVILPIDFSNDVR